MFKKIYGPLTMQWEMIPSCNYNCIHCYNYWRRSNESVAEDLWSLNNGFIIVDEIIKSKVNQITITGGEPLLVFDKIVPYIDKLLSNGIRISMNTNASLIDDRIAQYLSNNSISILVSLPCCIPEINDQITDCSGSFEHTVSGIKVALKHRVRVSINMVVSKLNQNHVISTAQFIKNEFGLENFCATKVGKPINATEEFVKYSMQLSDFRRLIDDLLYVKHELGMSIDSLTAYPHCSFNTEEGFQLIGSRRSCSAGKTAAAIGYDGSIKACPREQQTYGDLENDSLINCWNKMSDWRGNAFLPKNCQECNHKEVCSGGCRVESFAINSSLKADDPCSDWRNHPKHSQPSSHNNFEFSNTDIFLLNSNFEILNEEFGFRITINSQSRFITEELYNFIQKYSGKEFSRKDLENYFDIDQNLANELASFLKQFGLAILI